MLDVEADGPHPVEYNMISFGLVSVANPSLTFKGMVAPRLGEGLAEARAVSGISYVDQLNFPKPLLEMQRAQAWLCMTAGRDVPVTIWSDNPAFDWQFWNAYCWLYNGANIAGYSARRIGDMDAGRRCEPFVTGVWKKWRQVSHNHDPVMDAQGNALALREIIKRMGEE